MLQTDETVWQFPTMVYITVRVVFQVCETWRQALGNVIIVARVGWSFLAFWSGVYCGETIELNLYYMLCEITRMKYVFDGFAETVYLIR